MFLTGRWTFKRAYGSNWAIQICWKTSATYEELAEEDGGNDCRSWKIVARSKNVQKSWEVVSEKHNLTNFAHVDS